MAPEFPETGRRQTTLYDFVETIRDFLDQGGQVIVVIAFVIFVMWTMIIERLLYLRAAYPYHASEALVSLSARVDQGSWAFEAVRSGEISRLGQGLQAGIPLIRTLAAVCPLLGLLGTVTGMIVIFDVMAAMGNSSPRAVAGGVAQATMTTMAGMVGALSGVFPAAFLGRTASQKVGRLQNGTEWRALETAQRLPRLRQVMRVPLALVASLGITVVLLFGMQRLIETGEEALTDDVDIQLADFVRIRQEETIERKTVKPEKVPPPEQQPEVVEMRQTLDDSQGGVEVSLGSQQAMPSLSFNIRGVSGYSLQDGEFLPLVKVTPIYPRRAAARGMSGWVLLQFTITAAGTVENITVVESSDKLFERAAIQAALKYKYRPRVVNGVAVAVTGVLHSVVFEILED